MVVPLLIWLRLSRSTFLHDEPAEPPVDAPFVSVICPARNEARHIDGFVREALTSTYPRFELIIVDDHSADGTGALARAAGAGDARLTVIDAPPLPAGWFGKQWACHAGAERARGAVLLFTDADTRHGPELVVRSINAMRRRESDLLSVGGRQELGGFWERVVQPTIFVTLCAAFGGTETVSASRNPKAKIANGQCLFVRRDTYDALGGHEAVRGYVAEDLMLAQQWCAAGKRVHVVAGLDQMSTRMYGSLGEIIDGWSKNAFAGGRHLMPDNAVSQFITRITMPLPHAFAWFPFVALVLGAIGVLPRGWLVFGAAAYGVTTIYWLVIAHFIALPLWYAFLHPLGAVIASYIYGVAAWKGERVRWKEREYRAR